MSIQGDIMLVNFRVENYKSFKDFTEFSMKATKLKNLQESNSFDIANISLLKSAVVYGANASGKSSLLHAMRDMQKIVKSSTDIEKAKKYKAKPFLLNIETEKKPTIFEVEFVIDEVLYRYGFEIAMDATILEEWLFQKKLLVRSKEVRIFERTAEHTVFSSSFKEGKHLVEKTRDNALFLSVVAQFNGEISNKILKWFNTFNVLSSIKSEEFIGFSFNQLENENFREKIVNFIKSADVGIQNIKSKKLRYDELNLDEDKLNLLSKEIIENIKENGLASIETMHIQYDKDNSFDSLKSFELDFESDGTKKLLALSGPILDTLQRGSILIVDELDNSLHTELINAIIKLFNSKEMNPNNAQLIFSTHDTNLLNQKLFRRDQIWFLQKDMFGASELYSLVEYGKGKTRDDLVLEKNYLDGKFGGVPSISSLDFGDL